MVLGFRGVLGWSLGFWGYKGNRGIMPGTLVGSWPPSLSDYDACLVCWSNWASGGSNGRPKSETSFPSPLPRGITRVFLVSRTSMKRFWGNFSGFCGLGGPGTLVRLEDVLSVWRPLMWEAGLTHGDAALETTADFLAVSEHRLIPARVRSEWAELRRKGIHSVWAPASQALMLATLGLEWSA